MRIVDTATLRRLAVESGSDPRSVAKELQKPGSVRGEAHRRIDRVLVANGLRAALREHSTETLKT